MKKYRLLKDLPDLKAGAIFTPDPKNPGYFRRELADRSEYYYSTETMDQKEWFEEIKDDPKEYTKGDMISFAGFVADFTVSRHVVADWEELYLNTWLKSRC